MNASAPPPPASGDLRPFIGSKDFGASKAFYAALGCQVESLGDALALVTLGERQFLLQDYYQKDWCENSMLLVPVPDADAWRAHLDAAFPDPAALGARVMGPQDQDYGRVTYLSDPAGVLWQFTEFAS
ncbi:MAG: glyoxalase [Pseudomonadota bacterium]